MSTSREDPSKIRLSLISSRFKYLEILYYLLEIFLCYLYFQICIKNFEEDFELNFGLTVPFKLFKLRIRSKATKLDSTWPEG